MLQASTLRRKRPSDPSQDRRPPGSTVARVDMVSRGSRGWPPVATVGTRSGISPVHAPPAGAPMRTRESNWPRLRRISGESSPSFEIAEGGLRPARCNRVMTKTPTPHFAGPGFAGPSEPRPQRDARARRTALVSQRWLASLTRFTSTRRPATSARERTDSRDPKARARRRAR